MSRPQNLAEARLFLAQYSERATLPEILPLSKALGRILCKPIIAGTSLPRFDAAAMDGFAIRQEDLLGAPSVTLPISQVIAAGGGRIDPLLPKTAARIMTGACLPDGADRVVMQEDAVMEGSRVRITAPVGGKAHIRRVGEDLRVGAPMLGSGAKLGPGQIGLLAALAIEEVTVWRRPKVALLSTGDELREIGQALERGQIPDSNRPMLRAMLQASGAEVTDLGILPDDPNVILECLVRAAPAHDLIISSGGASEGFADHLAGAVAQRGCLEFWRLDMRPGKPVGFGDIDHCPVLLLPGNPFAAATAFLLLGQVLLDGLAGRGFDPAAPLRLPFAASFSKPTSRSQVLAARLIQAADGQGTMAWPLEKQGSASLSALSACDALILLEAGRETFAFGDLVDVFPIGAWSPGA